jgi:N-acetylglucosamine kinase-like BadF-type ATPase
MIVAGVDGGATSTRALIANEEGSILGYGSAGPSNYDNVGIDAARTNIAAALQTALSQSRLEPDSVRAAFFGMAGVVSATDRDVISRIAAACNLKSPCKIGVDHDIRIALAGGLAGEEGIVLIAGTGSSSYGRRNDGLNHRTGWGYLLDDLGSGYFLGLQAMIGAIHEADGRGAKTALSEHVREHLDFTDIDDILHILYHDHMSVTEIASLAPDVITCAEAGDSVALQIVSHGAEELARMVEAVATTLKFSSLPVKIAIVGGLTRSSFYLNLIKAAIQKRIRDSVIVDPAFPPVVGAVILAMELAGVRFSQSLSIAMRNETMKHSIL